MPSDFPVACFVLSGWEWPDTEGGTEKLGPGMAGHKLEAVGFGGFDGGEQGAGRV